jgi:hypothetical protein
LCDVNWADRRQARNTVGSGAVLATPDAIGRACTTHAASKSSPVTSRGAACGLRRNRHHELDVGAARHLDRRLDARCGTPAARSRLALRATGVLHQIASAGNSPGGRGESPDLRRRIAARSPIEIVAPRRRHTWP